MLERLTEFISQNKLLIPGEKLLLAVSGGIDSVIMTHLFSAAGIELGIAHCNYKLRGSESDGDEEFVRDLASKLNARFYCTTFPVKQVSAERKQSVQQAARELRYEWFEKIREGNGYHKIATAHHADDSIETFFINLMRGTGLRGLTGIPVHSGKIIRPLLFATREEITEYAQANNIRYREDSSNKEDIYLRNRIRHHLMPFLKSTPGFTGRMLMTMDHLADADMVMQEHAEKWMERHSSESEHELVLKITNEDGYEKKLAGALYYRFGIAGLETGKIIASTPGKVFHAPPYRIVRDRDSIILTDEVSAHPEAAELNETDSVTVAGNYRMEIIRAAASNDSIEPGTHVLDEGLLSYPLTIRAWKAGDRFVPLGMKGSRKLSDYLTDIRLSLPEKEKTMVILSGNDIVCILGHRIDERYKITEKTKRILKLKWKKIR